MNAILQAHLLKRYSGGFVLDANLQVDSKIHVLFGRSGSGKTTVLRLIAGLLKPSSGFVTFNQQTIYNIKSGISIPAYKRNMVLMMQEDTLFPHLTVRDNVRFADGNRESADRLLEQFEMNHLSDRKPAELSGGERRRVALLRCWAAQPRLLLLDEPLAGLDVATSIQFIDALKQLQQMTHIPILYVSHSIPECLSIADNVSVLEAGRIIAEGSPEEVLLGGSNDRSNSLASSLNIWKTRIAEQKPFDDITEIAIGKLTIEMHYIEGNVGDSIAVALSPADITISRSKVEGTSARNCINATIRQIDQQADRISLEVEAEGVVFRVRITPRSLRNLNLKPAQSVHLMFKAWSVKRLA
ncbi:ATP-binding cassette domain-containing protein [bacterium]|nr:ATP-binding cassette domain-containing protein [bacterium]MBU1653188.1 ATP-binding cassette domain-containing protein [bacterium]MBU1882282.1 ATP-binding cassette domain-containing protein [bacterium]